MKKFSYIIPFNSTIDNIIDLRKVLKWVNGWKNIEVIVVEYDKKTSKLEYISDPFTLISLENGDTNYCKSWAYNVGLKRSNSDIIICGDSKTTTNPQNIENGLLKLKEYDLVSPCDDIKEIRHNDMKDFNMMDENNIGKSVGSDNMDDRVITISSGITMYNKEILFKIGGWEEKFKMTCVDDFQSYKIRKLSKYIQLNGNSYKFPGPLPHNDDIVSHDVNTNNQLKSINVDQLQRYITSTYKNIGLKNKYG